MTTTPRPIPAAFAVAIALATISVALAGCTSPTTARPLEPAPEYTRPLEPGAPALRVVTDPSKLPDLARAYRQRDPLLRGAIDASIGWYGMPSSRRHFPIQGITHDRALASLLAFDRLLDAAPTETAFLAAVREQFDVYESVGYDGSGVVLFTGYYAPIFRASRTRTDRFAYPLYGRPDDLLTEPVTGAPLGRKTPAGAPAPYPTRAAIETGNLLAGRELVWLEDPLSAYLIHVNGSAKLRLTTGETMYVGYAGKTDRPYASLGRAMVEAGLLDENAVSLPAIRLAYRKHPKEVERLMRRNENFVFFGEYDGGTWPCGSLGVPVTGTRSLATDKSVYPRGGLVLVETESVTITGDEKDVVAFMLDQDTGGAIQAPGRADIFMGIGPGAEILAGGQYAEGRLYYLFLKSAYAARAAR